MDVLCFVMSLFSDVGEFKIVGQFKDKEKEARALACGGQSTAVLTARTWIHDDEAKECMGCKNGTIGSTCCWRTNA